MLTVWLIATDDVKTVVHSNSSVQWDLSVHYNCNYYSPYKKVLFSLTAKSHANIQMIDISSITILKGFSVDFNDRGKNQQIKNQNVISLREISFIKKNT